MNAPIHLYVLVIFQAVLNDFLRTDAKKPWGKDTALSDAFTIHIIEQNNSL